MKVEQKMLHQHKGEDNIAACFLHALLDEQILVADHLFYLWLLLLQSF